MSEADRVAVVVVHGIADQRPGQTLREVVQLLCDGEPRYVQGEIQDVLVPVAGLEPGNAISPVASPAPQPDSDAPTSDPARRWLWP